MSGMFLSALDQSVVGTAMRTIADDLKGLELQAWVTTAYLITSTISTPIYGKLGDIFGRRRLFIIAIVIFVFGSILSVFATSMYELAVYRAVQGLGAGGLFALAITILSDIVPPRERARYQGFILAVFASSSVLGPVVGGLFSGAHEILFIAGWKWIFLINIPFGAAALFLVWRFMHVPHNPVKHRIDWQGALTIVVGVVPMLLVAENGRQWGWASTTSIAMYAISIVGIVSFIFAERAAGEEAILPLKLFQNRTFALTTVLGVIVGIGMFGGMMTLPLLLQIVNGVTPTQSGFLMLPMVAGMMVATTVSGQITSKTGKYKIFMVIGTGMLMLGYATLFNYHYDTPLWAMSISMVIIGMGLGQLMQTLTLAAQNAVEPRDIGVATSSTMFFRQMGGTLGVAVFISLLFNNLPDRIADAFKSTAYGNPFKAKVGEIMAQFSEGKLPATDPNVVFIQSLQADPAAIGDKLNGDSSFLSTIDPVLARPFLVGFADSSIAVFVIAAAVVAVAFVLSFFLKAAPLREKSAAEENADAAVAAAAH
ncbi:MAG: DHA2 family efflux MFS transporter permease subunit [Microbacteriaceae bacterium]|nr:DHA2 family efflux MFS transporter permease subunit [Microbacteriaceae bacterium]